MDKRWVRCRRPVVTVGGELTLESLELGFAPRPASTALRSRRSPTAACSSSTTSDVSAASPRDILNRWIVPLESRVDYLTLQTGQKFEMPFEVLIVFATNLKPLDLVDESFLRRIRYKVYAESPTVSRIHQYLRALLPRAGAGVDRALVEALIDAELSRATSRCGAVSRAT